jgi:hypothetical protein
MSLKFYKNPLIFLALFLFLAAHAVSADTIGQSRSFFVNKEFDKNLRTSISATLIYIGERLNIYADDSYWNTLSSDQREKLRAGIINFSSEFDSVIYPKETQFWGSEPNPGVDNDPKMTIVLEELNNSTGGYFDTSNGYTSDRIADSNQREMIFLDIKVFDRDLETAKRFVAHEFQHLISFNQKELLRDVYEDAWINEMRSEYAISRVGYNDIYSNSNLEHRMESFLQNPSDSLTEWPNKNTDYGIANAFGEYIAEQFGPEILSETLKMPFAGISSLDQYLQSKARPERFSDVFINWMAAVTLNDISRDSRFGYKRPELNNVKVSARQVSLSQDWSASEMIRDWQPVWLELSFNGSALDVSKSVKIDINGDPGEKYLVTYIAFFDSGEIKSGNIKVIAGRGTDYVINSGSGLSKILLLATKATRTTGFSRSEPSGLITFAASVVDTKKAEASALRDGSLIKRPHEPELYVVWGKYKRYLNPEIIKLYGHLDPANAIELEPETFDSYVSSNYVRYINDERVYTVWPDGTKHWLNITPRQWDATGRDWGSIFIINDLELNNYKSGVDIIR